MTTTTAPAPTVTDLKPGDRVRCYDAFNGTVVRVANAAGDPYAVVQYDHGEWLTSVYPPYVQSITA